MNLLLNKKENNNFIKELNSFYQFENLWKKEIKHKLNYEKTLIFFEQKKIFYNKINYEDNRLNKNININHFKQISFKLLN